MQWNTVEEKSKQTKDRNERVKRKSLYTTQKTTALIVVTEPELQSSNIFRIIQLLSINERMTFRIWLVKKIELFVLTMIFSNEIL